MSIAPHSMKVAILVANGVEETELTEMQRALAKASASFKTISPEQGLVNSWHGNGWGHYLPTDAVVGEVLGSDYDALIIPGGLRAAAKLMTNLHARRIVNHFYDANKLVSASGAGVALLALGARASGRSVVATPADRAALEAAGLRIVDGTQTVDGNLLSVVSEDVGAWVAATLDHFLLGDDQTPSSEARAA